jgi:hypothetical protein
MGAAPVRRYLGFDARSNRGGVVRTFQVMAITSTIALGWRLAGREVTVAQGWAAAASAATVTAQTAEVGGMLQLHVVSIE